MRPKLINLIGTATLSAVSACSLLPRTLVDEGIVKIDIEKTSPIQVAHATAYREDDQTVVRGEARQPFWEDFGVFRGHIDINLEFPNGQTMKKNNIRLVLKNFPKKRGRRASFVVRLPINPPEGTIIRIAYHERSHRS